MYQIARAQPSPQLGISVQDVVDFVKGAAQTVTNVADTTQRAVTAYNQPAPPPAPQPTILGVPQNTALLIGAGLLVALLLARSR